MVVKIFDSGYFLLVFWGGVLVDVICFDFRVIIFGWGFLVEFYKVFFNFWYFDGYRWIWWC